VPASSDPNCKADLHTGHDALPRLDDSAIAQIRSAEAQAEVTLTLSLRGFFALCEAGKGEMANRNPSSSDLVPFVEKYAEAVGDAEVRERLKKTEISGDTNPESGLALLNDVADKVAQRIVSDGGVWARVVEDACRYSGLGTAILGVHMTRHGTYTVEQLMVPRQRQLRAALSLWVRRWEGKLWKAMGEQRRLRAKNDFLESVKQRFKKAQRLTQAREKKKINVKDFAKRQLGTNETVIYSLQRGELRCSEDKLKKIAEKLDCSARDLYREEFDGSKPHSGSGVSSTPVSGT
jgi:ribosome-binding protein aMBF1 (putative translation factor)